MEQGYYTFWFIIVFILFYLSSIQKDNQKKIMYLVISAVMFLALAFLSFGTYNLVYDASTSTFVKYNEAEFSLQAMFPFGLNLIFSIICLLELFIAVGQEWGRNTKGLKIPKGF